MGNLLVGGIYVVQAIKGDQTEYWAAATIREKAVTAVEKELGDGWTVTLTDRRDANGSPAYGAAIVEAAIETE
jgi:hypothetical protein